MPASHAAPPQPLPLPPPPLSLPSPPSAPRRGRHRASTSSSSSCFCPSPSPAASPRGSTASLVPFSWERHPGVPKASSRDHGSPAAAPLPLPPPFLRVAPRRRRCANAKASKVAAAVSADRGTESSDPFVAAFAECTRDDADDDGRDPDAADVPVVVPDKLWLARTTKPAPASGRADRRWWLAGGSGFLDLYGCKSASMAVADGAFLARRPVVAHAHGRRASRR